MTKALVAVALLMRSFFVLEFDKGAVRFNADDFSVNDGTRTHRLLLLVSRSIVMIIAAILSVMVMVSLLARRISEVMFISGGRTVGRSLPILPHSSKLVSFSFCHYLDGMVIMVMLML
jgi:hypothetical protein